jgi:hypothetical protein
VPPFLGYLRELFEPNGLAAQLRFEAIDRILGRAKIGLELLGAPGRVLQIPL